MQFFFVTQSVDIQDTLLIKRVSGGRQGLNIKESLKECTVQLFQLKRKTKRQKYKVKKIQK